MEIAIIENRKDLERLEGIIEKNLAAFYEVGKALIQIKQKEYYVDVLGYDTFEQYCKERWDMSRPRAYQLIDAVMIKDNLSTMVDIPERQLRPLARLEPQQQREAWEMAVETAPDGKVTARHVSRVVSGMLPQTEIKKEQGVSLQEPSDAMAFAVMAISQLERIHPKDPQREDALERVEKWITKNKRRVVK